MVLLKEFSNMFWGVTLDGGKRYSQTVDKPFHLSMAALESNPHVNERTQHVQVMLQHESSEFLLCTLGHSNVLQQQLDISFSSGEEITFYLNGGGVVHLTGSLLDDLEDEPFVDDYDDDDVDSDLQAPQLTMADEDESDSDEEDEDWEPALATGSKRKMLDSLRNKGKKLKLTALNNEDESEESEEYESSFIDDEGMMDDEDDSEEEDEDLGEEEEEEEQDDDSMVEELVQKKSPKSPNTPASSKKGKKSYATSEATPTSSKKKEKSPKKLKAGEVGEEPVANGSGDQPSKKKKKKKKKNKNKNDSEEVPQKQQKQEEATQPSPKPSPAPGKKRTVAGGIGVEDTKIGHGPEAKPGKSVSVYYAGTLAKNNKRFDSCEKGKPFRFRLGRGEVIKGWDTGLIGMKVGGKRRLTVPPAQGYGNSRQGPIPPGSTLVFDVELKAVN